MGVHYFVVDPEGLRRKEWGGDRFKIWWQILRVDVFLCVRTHVRGREGEREGEMEGKEAVREEREREGERRRSVWCQKLSSKLFESLYPLSPCRSLSLSPFRPRWLAPSPLPPSPPPPHTPPLSAFFPENNLDLAFV